MFNSYKQSINLRKKRERYSSVN